MEDKKVIVTKIWSDIFGEENSDYDDNFFELGGDSIMALKMSEQLKQKGYTISLMEVFDDPTLGGVLDSVRPLSNAAGTSSLTEKQKRSYPATIQQKWFFRRITRERDLWCEYAVISPKNAEGMSPEKVLEFLFEKKLLRNFNIIRGDNGLFFEMSEDTPILVKTEAPLSHQAGENAARENISLENGKTCCMVYDNIGNMMIIIHHLFSDAVTLKNILSAIDKQDADGDFDNALYCEYAWEQYGKSENIKDDLSYMEESVKSYNSDETVMTSGEDCYDTLVDISKEWGVSVESILIVQLYNAASFLPETVIEVERIGRDTMGKWDVTCGWISFSAALDLSCTGTGKQCEMAARIGKAVGSLTFEKDGLDGSEPEKALTWNYIGNIDISSDFDSFTVMDFGQFSGKNTGRSTPIYFTVYFKKGRLYCNVNYDSLIYTREQMNSFQKAFLTNVQQLSDNYNTKHTDELSSILEVMGGV